MVILNKEILGKNYRCKRDIMRFLVYTAHLSVLSYDEEFYYFVDDDNLRKHLDKMPLTLKISSGYFLPGGSGAKEVK